MNITAYIRKTDALDKPWYVDYTIESAKYDVRVDIKATGFDCYGAAHAHATAMGAEIVDDVQCICTRCGRGGVLSEFSESSGGCTIVNVPCIECNGTGYSTSTTPDPISGLPVGRCTKGCTPANEQAGERARDAVLEWQPDETGLWFDPFDKQ